MNSTTEDERKKERKIAKDVSWLMKRSIYNAE
jgi:hypothetical protein